MSTSSGYPLTPTQQNVWFDQLRYPDSVLYNLGGFTHIHGALDVELLAVSLRHQINSHDSMRLFFDQADGAPSQRAAAHLEVPLDVVDLEIEPERSWREEGETLFRTPFDLDKPPLFRFRLYRENDKKHHLLCIFHHLTVDGYGVFMFIDRLFEDYRRLCDGGNLDHGGRPAFLQQGRRLSSTRLEKSKAFWRSRLTDLPPALEPVLGKSKNTPNDPLAAGLFAATLPRQLVRDLKWFAAQHQTALFPIFLNAYALCLAHLFDRRRTAVGVSLRNRSGRRGKATIGHFADNTLVVPDVDLDVPFYKNTMAVKRELNQVYRHHGQPFATLAKWGMSQGLSRLFEASFSYESPGFDFNYGNLELDYEALIPLQLTHPLHLSIRNYREDRDLLVLLEYQESFIDAFGAEELTRWFCQVLQEAAAHPQHSGRKIIQAVADRDPRPRQWSKLDQSVPVPNTNVADLFRQRAENHAQRPALHVGGHPISYATLAKNIHRLAYRLRTGHGLKHGEVVGILAENSADFVVGVFATLQSGGVFLPLNPDDPPARVDALLRRAGARFLLSDGRLHERRIRRDGIDVIPFEEEPSGLHAAHNLAQAYKDDPVELNAADTAYLIYTSGTSGEPKAVAVSHGALTNLATNFLSEDFENLDQPQRIAVVDVFYFDAAYHSLFGALLYGHTLYICPRETAADAYQLMLYLEKHEIDGIGLTPRLITQLYSLPAMRHRRLPRAFVESGNETLGVAEVNRLLDDPARGDLRLINYYGPTETCVEVTRHHVQLDQVQELGLVPIGKPEGGLYVVILNQQGGLTPPGFLGELFIGGPGLAQGYRGDATATAEHFVPSPFGNGARLYRTGDLGRWLPDGTIAFSGRLDQQMKVRGYRVEAGEVEHHLKRIETVRDAAVKMVRNTRGEWELAAYLEANLDIDTDGVRSVLTRALPHYMIPTHFTLVGKLPYTERGKINKRALPLPSETRVTDGTGPRDDLERLLVYLFSKVLALPEVGITDNFFALGGQSLSGARLINELRAEGLNLRFRDLFERPTVGELAKILRRPGHKPPAPIQASAEQSDYPCSHGQERLWLLHQVEQERATYNMCGAYWMEGNLDRDALELATRLMFQHHAILRTTIHLVKGEPRQRINPMPEQLIKDYDFRDKPDPTASAIRATRRFGAAAFDLSSGPLIRLILIRTEDRRHLLSLCLHHIAGDAVSVDLLLEQFSQAYNAYHQGAKVTLKPPLLQYRDYAVWQRGRALLGSWQVSRRFWNNRLADLPEPLLLPIDFQRPPVRTAAGHVVRIRWEPSLTQVIDRLARDRSATRFAVLYALTTAFFYRLTGQDDILMGTPSSGRTHPDLKNIVGFLVNTIVLRTNINGDMNLFSLLEESAKTIANAFDHSDYPFDLMVEAQSGRRDPSRHPLFDVLLTLEQSEPANINLSELRTEGLDIAPNLTKFDLIFNFKRNENDLVLEAQYNTDLFRPTTIDALLQRFTTLASAWAEQPECPLARIHLLSVAEWNRLNTSQLHEPLKHHHLFDAFEACCMRFPDRVAIHHKDGVISYEALGLMTMKLLAHPDFVRWVVPGTVVAVEGKRDPETIAASLAVTARGAAFTWLDLRQPAEKTAAYVQAAGVTLFIKMGRRDEGDTASLPSHVQILPIAGLLNQDALSGPLEEQPRFAEQTAYVVFTSGSTGQPKPIAVSHHALLHQLDATRADLALRYPSQRHIAGTSSMMFDAAIDEIWATLVDGHTWHPIDEEMRRDPHQLLHVLESKTINTLVTTPSYLDILLDAGLGLRPLHLETLRLGGEVLKASQIQRLRDRTHSAAVTVFNYYGPSEICVNATHYQLKPGPASEHHPPIGTAISHMSVLLLDRDGNPVPSGFTGEICIAGAGLAQGYMNLPRETAAAFRPHPLLEGARIYHSGDLGRVDEHGEIHFMGRRDQQVKIRGYRIECGEIEQVLARLEGVSAAVVIPYANAAGQWDLAAYVVAKSVDIAELRRRLKEKLPAYMEPAVFMKLHTLPLTRNGKVDRNALPDPLAETPDEGRGFSAPNDGLERLLADLWRGVLGFERIGRNDNFFDLGGNSLKAARLAVSIHRRLDTQPATRDIFAHPTIAELAVHLCQREPNLYHPIPKASKQPSYPVSHSQKRLWTARQLAGDSAAYNLPECWWLEGRLNKIALEQAFQSLFTTYQVLRTRFVMEGSDLRQIVDDATELPMSFEDFSEETESEKAALRLAVNEANIPFNLDTEVPIRVLLIRTEPTRHLLVVTLHHIAADGWSMPIIWSHLVTAYQGVVSPPGEPIPAPAIQYVDYAVWQAQQLHDGAWAEQQRYWLNHMAGELPQLQLVTDVPRPALRSYKGADYRFRLDGPTTRAVHALSRNQGTTVFSILSSAVFALLYRYSAQNDLICGVTVAGRRHVDLDQQIGLFLNTLPLRCAVDGGESFLRLMQQVSTLLGKALQHSDYPIDRLIEELEIKPDPARSPLFDVLLVNQDTDAAPPQLQGITAAAHEIEKQQAKFDLTFYFQDDGERIHLSLEYNADLFSPERMQRLGGHLSRLIKIAVQEPHRTVGMLDMLTSSERNKLVFGVNQTAFAFDNNYTLGEAFSAGAAVYPNREALQFSGRSHTYSELESITNVVANALVANHSVSAGTFAAVYTRRSDWTVIGILGVLKAGAAFVPLDLELPPSRAAFMVEDAGCDLILTDGSPLPKEVAATGVTVVDLRTVDGADTALPAQTTPMAPAYAIYTSGSTGKPKGVVVSHRSVINLVFGLEATIYGRHRQHLHEALVAPFIFDASVQQVFGSLLLCHTLHVLDDTTRRDAETLCHYLETQGIHLFDVTPGLFHAMLEAGFGNKPCALKHITIGSELVATDLIRTWRARPGAAQVIMTNTYGPTEACVEVSTYQLGDELDTTLPSLPIGKPMPNTRIYLLERDGDLAPVGVPGEICIAGEGLALGYLNRADLTADAFRPHPWEGGERLYHTGDLAVRLPSGDILFLGRRDHQVKIRGYRIECGEVEQALLRHPQIEGAVVTAREFDGGHQDLTAYLIGEEVPLAPLREHLSAFLPHYMIPRYLVFLERFPLNANNKVDRDKLPDPRDRSPESGVHVPPRDRLEAKLLDLWRAQLGLAADDKLGVHDHFFEKGGHSLTATRLVAAIHRVLGVQLPLRVLFEAVTVAAQADVIREQEPTAFIPIQPIPTAPHYPLSHAQKRLWLLHNMDAQSVAYNIPAYTQLVGDLDVSALRASFMAMMRRHESLRTTFAMVDGEPRQFVHAGRPLPFSEVLLDDLEDADLVARGYAQKEFNKPFDLSSGPLMRITLLKLEPKRHLLLVTMHHIISDGWSMGIWLKELSHFYAAQVLGRAPRLPELGVQYRDYAHWQSRLLDTPMMQQQRTYWLEQLKAPRVDCSLPTAQPRPRVRTFAGATHHFQLDPPLVNGLRALGLRHGASLFMTLIALVKVVLFRYSGRGDIRLGSAVANRTHADLEGVIGFFVNNLVLRDQLDAAMTFEQVLHAVRLTTTTAYENQDYPFDLLVEELESERDPARHPLFDVFVVLQNNELDPPDLPGVQMATFDMRTTLAKFDLLLDFHEDGEALDVRLEYNSDTYTSAGMFRLIAHIVELTRSVLAHPRRALPRLEMLTQLDRIQLFSTFCPDQHVFSQTETVIELFEAAASRMHRDTALVFGEERWTYHQLNQAVNQWAHFLREEQGIKPGDVVGVLANRDPWSVVALLAVLKAGGVYLPIDPDNPASRRAAIIADAGCRRLLVGRGQDLPELAFAPPVYELERLPNTSKINPGVACHQSDPAYIIYTSGSTGHPKGVLGTHRCLYNLVQWQRANHRTMREMRTLQYAPLGFDVSLQEILFTLITHGELHLVSREQRGDLAQLTDLIQKHEIESVTMPYSVLNLFLHEEADLEKLASLRHVITSGEQPYFTRGIRRFLEHYTDARLHNQYGPSETHVVTSFMLNHESEVSDRIPLGRPISNTRAYVIDELGQVAPIGCYGEIWIGGANVGLGYVNQQELTAQRFTEGGDLPDPLVYRTGDHGRWTEDGLLEFTGRADEQIKIRGYRVEFNEIRRVIKSHSAVHEVAVIDWIDPDGETQLLAYYASRPRVASSVLRQYVAARLPAYMVPAFIFPLDTLPKTHTGKLDRAALPRPVLRRGPEVQPPSPPTNAVEERLRDLWQDALGTAPIGIDDPFFEMGGTSLKGMKLVFEIQAKLGYRLDLGDLFRFGDIRRLAAALETFPRQPFATIPAGGPAAHYPVGYGQRQLWLHQQNEPNSVAYNVTAFYEAQGTCYGSLFRKAVHALVQRHEILRTTYRLVNDELRQFVGEVDETGIRVMDLSHFSTETRYSEAESIARREAETPFDLAAGPVLRATLVRFDENHYLILLNIHHIAVDGLSLRILVEELQLLYHAFINDFPHPLTMKRLQYRDAVAFLNRRFSDAARETQRAYWRQRFSPVPEPLVLPTYQPRPAVMGSEGAVWVVPLGEVLSRRLEELAGHQHVSLFMLLLGLVNTLLYRYTGQEDIVVGTPEAGRPHPDLAHEVGYFVNMLALRTEVAGSTRFSKVLADAAAVATEAFHHAQLPFDEVVAEVAPPVDLSRNPLFDVVLVLQDGVDELPDLEGLRLKPHARRHQSSRFDLTFNVTQTRNELVLTLEYRTALFEASFIERCGRHFAALAEQVCHNPDQRIAAVNLLHQSEWQQLESFQNVAGLTLPEADTMTLFASSAQKHANRTAVFFRKQKMTYTELDHYANGLAHILLKRKELQQPEPVIGVLAEPNAAAVVALLAILKVGGVYLPISQAVPGDRALGMLKDAGAVLLIGPDHLYQDLQAWLEEPLEIPVLIQNKLPRPRKQCPHHPVDLDQAAYIIFTSGSTGRPKGVVGTHRGLINTALDQGRTFEIGPDERMLKLADLGFDASLYETFIALFHGASLYCVDYETYRDQNHFLAYIAENEITWALMPPAYLRTLDRKALPSLKFLISAGESGDPGDLGYYAQHKTVINAYGPTETSVCASNHFVEPHRRYPFGVPLGHPLANCELWVLNEMFLPMPVGVTGEIAIAGPGLARGYLHAHWTAAHFVPHPFAHGERLYLTGDRGFWNEQGELVFMGRRDSQVSLHGFRIECGEVVHALRENMHVKDAYVMVRNVAATPHLVAYVVRQNAVTADELRHHLLHRLISYMVPSHFVFLEAFPLTANGKIDSRQLPEPARGGIRPDDLDPPRDRFEQMLYDLFCLILNLEEVSLYDHFFELGGHSLSAVKLKTLLLEHYGITLLARAVFENPTIADLAQHLRDQEKLRRSRRQTPEATIPRYDHGGDETYPAAFAQQRMWSRHGVGSTAYHLGGAFWVEGLLDVDRLRKAVQLLLQTHPALRTAFFEFDGAVWQKPMPLEQALDFQVRDIQDDFDDVDDVDEAKIARAYALSQQAANHPFDLGSGRPLRVLVVQLSDDYFLMSLTVHHIVADGWSVALFVAQLNQLMRDPEMTEPAPPLLSYGDWAAWQRQRFAPGDEEGARARAFWHERFNPLPPLSLLPADKPRGGFRTYVGERLEAVFDKELGSAVRKLAARQGTGSYTTWLTLFAILLYRRGGSRDWVVGTVVSGRERTETDDVMGLFANTLALPLHIDPRASFKALLRQTHQLCDRAFEYGDYPFDLLVDELDPPRDLAHHPLFDVMFSWQNQDLQELDFGPHIQFTPSQQSEPTCQFDVTLQMRDSLDGTLALELTWRKDLYSRERMAELPTQLEQLARSALAATHEPVGYLPYIPPERLDLIQRRFAHGRVANFPLHLSLAQLIETRAQQYHDQIALAGAGEKITYATLHHRAQEIAHALWQRDIRLEQPVTVSLDRTQNEWIQCLLGIVLAGGVFHFLDPDLPLQRRLTILDETQSRLLFGNREDWPEAEIATRDIKLTTPHLLHEDGREPAHADELPLPSAANLAYLISTSGTRGTPKQVMVEGRSLINSTFAKIETYQMSDQDHVLQFASPMFDVALSEVFTTFFSGACLVLMEPEALAPDRFPDFCEANGVTVATLPPSFLHSLEKRDLPGIRLIASSGDSPVWEDVRHYSRHHQLANAYGPTEAAVCSHLYLIPAEPPHDGIVPVGRPIANTQTYILDELGQPLPVGVVGEIALGGEGLARGYWQDPAATAAAWVPHPFADGQRLYRTGDRGRWRDDGCLEILGRLDDQLKIRGFRVNLHEIALMLNKHQAVDMAVVVQQPDAAEERCLVAYLKWHSAYEPPSPSELRHWLRHRLPHYMVPTYFVSMRRFPLGVGGKIQHDRLPEPDPARHSGNDDSDLQLDGEIAETLAALWRDLLACPKPHAQDHFFELGGHSLRATVLTARVRAAFNRDISLRDIFQTPIFGDMVALIEQAPVADTTAIPSCPGDTYPITPTQHRLYALYRHQGGTDAGLHLSAGFRMQGRWDWDSFRRATIALINRHDVLRTAFVTEDDITLCRLMPLSSIRNQLKDYLTVRYTTDPTEVGKMAMDTVFAPFQLEKGLTWRLLIVREGDEGTRFYLSLHRILIDAWGLSLLLREWSQLYQALAGNKPNPLPAPSLYFRDVAHHLSQRDWDGARAFWKRRLANTPELLPLPYDYARDFDRPAMGGLERNILPADIVDVLNNTATKQGTTLANTILAVWFYLMHELTQQEDMVIGVGYVNRELPELQDMVGLFANVLLLRVSIEEDLTFTELLDRVSTEMGAAMRFGDYPFEAVMDLLGQPVTEARQSLVNVMYSFQNERETRQEQQPPQAEDEPALGDIWLKPTFTPLDDTPSHHSARFDLTLFAYAQPNGTLRLDLEYDAGLFASDTAESLGRKLVKLLQMIVQTPI